MRVALLTNVLSPYRLPVFRELASTPDVSLRVFVCTRSELHWAEAQARAYEDGCRQLAVERPRTLTVTRRISLNADAASRQRVETHWPVGLPGSLRRFRPDVIVASELGPRCAIGALTAAWLGVPLVIWSYHSRSAARTVGRLQRAWRRALLARADAVVGMGRQAREVLMGYGVPPSRIFDAPNAHDPAMLDAALVDLEPLAARHALRAAAGARERVALVAGRLVEAKGAHLLLEHWRSVPAAARADWTLLFVGDGPLAAQVREAARAHPGEIVHQPAVATERMAALYAAADLMVFPSLGDPWGLAVNEALACGLPVLCSRHAGCADDLIEPGRNGWLYDPTDPSGAARMLTEALRSHELASLGTRARETVKRFGPDTMADGFRRAIEHATAAQRRSEA